MYQVAAGAPRDLVVTATAEQRVLAGVPVDQVVAVAAEDAVVPGVSVDQVIAGTTVVAIAVDQVVSGTFRDRVDPVAGLDGVIEATADDRVVAAAGGDDQAVGLAGEGREREFVDVGEVDRVVTASGGDRHGVHQFGRDGIPPASDSDHPVGANLDDDRGRRVVGGELEVAGPGIVGPEEGQQGAVFERFDGRDQWQATTVSPRATRQGQPGRQLHGRVSGARRARVRGGARII